MLAVIVAAVLLAACSGTPVPDDKQEYVGVWKGVGVDLTITADGGVSYKRVSGSGSVSVSAPLKRFEGDDFIVGLWFMTTKFKVDRPPFESAGKWQMVVEGRPLTRIMH